MAASFTLAEILEVTWERFTTMFKDEYVPPVERESLAQKFLSLKQGTESMTVITRMFHERALFCPEHVSSEQARMSRYLRIEKWCHDSSTMISTRLRHDVMGRVP